MARSAIGMTGPHNNLYISFHPHWLYFRTGGRPVGEIPLSASHSEPVFKTMWISSKTGSEFFTASSDGTVRVALKRHFRLKDLQYLQILWWDTRKFTAAVEKLILDPYLEDKTNTDTSLAQGASILEYEWTIPSKFMVGTQQGNVFSCNRLDK